jgi:hypothetical protein
MAKPKPKANTMWEQELLMGHERPRGLYGGGSLRVGRILRRGGREGPIGEAQSTVVVTAA